MFPSGEISILQAAGALGRPGMVIISPVSTTINPAPADTLASLTVIENPVGRPSFVGSSDREYWVLATQIGRPAKPKLNFFDVFSAWAV